VAWLGGRLAHSLAHSTALTVARAWAKALRKALASLTPTSTVCRLRGCALDADLVVV